jgi:hypothetical protein
MPMMIDSQHSLNFSNALDPLGFLLYFPLNTSRIEDLDLKSRELFLSSSTRIRCGCSSSLFTGPDQEFHFHAQFQIIGIESLDFGIMKK